MSVFDYSVPSFLKNDSKQSSKLFSWLANTMANVKYAIENLDVDNFCDVTSVKSELLGSTLSEIASSSASVQLMSSDVAKIKSTMPEFQCGKANIAGVTAGSTTYTKKVTFAKPFSSVPTVILCPYITAPNIVYFSVSAVTTTSFTIHCYYTRALVSETGYVNWLAIA